MGPGDPSIVDMSRIVSMCTLIMASNKALGHLCTLVCVLPKISTHAKTRAIIGFVGPHVYLCTYFEKDTPLPIGGQSSNSFSLSFYYFIIIYVYLYIILSYVLDIDLMKLD